MQGEKERPVLRGFVLTCCYCRAIRDEHNQWRPRTDFAADHTAVKFSHGVCPPCFDRVVKEIRHNLTRRSVG